MFKFIADLVVVNWLRLDVASPLGSSLNFFIYDVLKIAISILIIISIISYLRTYLDPEKIKSLLAKQKFGLNYLIASLFGAVSPFCSCSSIPFFIGFIKAGAPMGVAFSFLITSPLVNEILFVMMVGVFGFKIAIWYVIFGVALGVAGGMVLQRTGLESDVIRFSEENACEQMPTQFNAKLKYAWEETMWIFKKVFPYIIIGVAIGAFIHGYVPTELITRYINSDSIWSVPIATLLGVPLYAGCSTLVPIIFAFTQKGIAMGTAMAFMMAVAGLSLPEAILLKSVMKTRLLLIFFAIVSVGIMIVGYLFNIII